MYTNLSNKLNALALIASASLLVSGSALADSNAQGEECAKKHAGNDAWIDTRLETAYLFNPHLNNFTIKTEVEGGDVSLTGKVRSEIDKDLASEIAKSLDGVSSVDNKLEVVADLAEVEQPDVDRDFLQKVSDATTTTQVKTKLIANENITAKSINVDTRNQVVRLSGEVNSQAQKQLAEYIARNTSSVKSVQNELEVVRSTG
jgi:osmotically-inducible protein OsmY